MQKAQKAVNGLLNTPEETQTGETQQQNSPEPQNEESSNEEQPQEQEISEETESEEEEVSSKMYLKTKNKLILKRNKIPPKKNFTK